MPKTDKPVAAEVDPFDLPAPQWVTRFAYFAKLGLGLFLALSLFLSGCSARAAEFWTPALELLSVDQIKTIIADHTSFTLTHIPEEWVKRVRSHQSGNFYLIDFHSEGLCGSGGCLYVGYLLDENAQTLSHVLSLRVKPELPPGVPLFEIDSSREVEPPCLKVHELVSSQLLQSTFCFDGTEYVKESTIAQPMPTHAN
jgi:hypothetical protein